MTIKQSIIDNSAQQSRFNFTSQLYLDFYLISEVNCIFIGQIWLRGFG